MEINDPSGFGEISDADERLRRIHAARMAHREAKESSECMTVAEHEAASEVRYEKLCDKIETVKENIMSNPEVNVYQKDPMAGVMPLLMGGGYGGAGACCRIRTPQ